MFRPQLGFYSRDKRGFSFTLIFHEKSSVFWFVTKSNARGFF